MMAKMATYIPSSTYVEIEAAGHLVNLEQPKAFDGALEHFLNTVRVTA
jgi:3-oxoadipate enol-lactonase